MIRQGLRVLGALIRCRHASRWKLGSPLARQVRRGEAHGLSMKVRYRGTGGALEAIAGRVAVKVVVKLCRAEEQYSRLDGRHQRQNGAVERAWYAAVAS
jgi:hypothetical protein